MGDDTGSERLIGDALHAPSDFVGEMGSLSKKFGVAADRLEDVVERMNRATQNRANERRPVQALEVLR
ncbi:MAG: hypothetical protein AB1806_01760 [Acidobacteriota bacterium]